MLERVAGGYAFRAAREAAEACGRLFERPVERGLSQAALETLAIVAYMGPVSRPEIARIRGVAADSAVASLVERGLIAEAGRESGPGGAVRYRVTPLFERVFGLDTPRGAAAPRRPRRRDRGDPRAAARGRRGTGLLICSRAGSAERIPAARIPRLRRGRSLKASLRGRGASCGRDADRDRRSSRAPRSSTSPGRGRCSRPGRRSVPTTASTVFTVADDDRSR